MKKSGREIDEYGKGTESQLTVPMQDAGLFGSWGSRACIFARSVGSR
jgi:hypothetical protein